MIVRTGLEVLADERFARLKGRRVGLVTHPAAVDRNYRSAAELFAGDPNVKLVALFGPEHGFTGAAQDLEGVAAEPSPFPNIICHSLYGHTIASLRPSPEVMKLVDVLVVDMVDVGSRYYTFGTTMLYCMEEAARMGKGVLVLDRPNPIGGAAEGPALKPGFESFVGGHDIAIRHGMTLGELARMYRKERNLSLDLDVVKCEGWNRADDYATTGLPWVNPSPNMPAGETAVVYPGMCLLEGTNLSEGRGTTRPFEIVGAPEVNAYRLAAALNAEKFPGAYFRSTTFKPTFQKHAGVMCGGVQLHVTDRTTFEPVRAGLATMMALRQSCGKRFEWRTAAYEFVIDPIAIDLLFGSDRERLAIEAGSDWRSIAAAWEPEEQQFRERRAEFLLYA